MITPPSLPTLTALLDALAVCLPNPPATLQGWQVTRILGGHNNLVYRVTRGDTQLAVKWTRRDERDRALMLAPSRRFFHTRKRYICVQRYSA